MIEVDAMNGNNTEWKFNSIVCFDLETTGLPQFGPVKITEFALVGVVRSHINAKSFITLPRVSHKLSFTVYPHKMISLDSSRITGLYNDILEPIKPWGRGTFEMLLNFLNLLPPPICLVAHNGYKFDFPIFKQHVQQISQSLPNNIICVDSMPAFQKILGEDVKKSSSLIEKMIEDMASDNEILIKAVEEEELKLGGVLASKQNEITPDSKILPTNSNQIAKQKNNLNSASELPNSSKSKVRRRLFPAEYPVSYKLTDIYSHLFKHPPERAHNAEEDAITLMKCILKVAPDFLKYANENHKTLESV